jgi:hypothetical protein
MRQPCGRPARPTIVALFCVALVGGVIPAAGTNGVKPVPPVLNDRTFAHWRKYIHPSAAERAWETPGWQTSLWKGLSLAQERKKPFLFWSMTGHPCGMT